MSWLPASEHPLNIEPMSDRLRLYVALDLVDLWIFEHVKPQVVAYAFDGVPMPRPEWVW